MNNAIQTILFIGFIFGDEIATLKTISHWPIKDNYDCRSSFMKSILLAEQGGFKIGIIS